MDDSLGIHYIEHYDKHTRHFVEDVKGNIQSYRILLMDNHSSHLTWQFIQYALSRKIILVALPPHSTHKLQPLDIGCFGPLQHYYGIQVNDFCRYSHAGVNKEYFMKLYPAARVQAFTHCNAWKATGLLPYNPTAVLKTLPYIKDSAGLETDPLITNTSLQPPKTPKTVKDLEFLRNQIAESTTGRPDGMLESPIQQRLEKLFKATVGFAADTHIQREDSGVISIEY